MKQLIEQALTGHRRSIARLITQVEYPSNLIPIESQSDPSEERRADARVAQKYAIIKAIYPHTGRAHIVGVTGAPGSGKSTLVNALAKQFRKREQTVAIIAVDPSSPFTGGALLGDRIRMTDLYGDKGIFIRSMASRGNLGGLARATDDVIKVLDASQFDIILIETVGAGQAEVDIAQSAHTTLVIEAPGMGDDIQSIKAGILEIADILVVNKADKPGKDNTVKALRTMLQLGHRVGPADTAWIPPVLETIALEDQGVDALADAIDAHKASTISTGEWRARAKKRAWREIEQLLVQHFMLKINTTFPLLDERNDLISAVVDRKLDPHSVSRKLLAQIDSHNQTRNVR